MTPRSFRARKRRGALRKWRRCRAGAWRGVSWRRGSRTVLLAAGKREWVSECCRWGWARGSGTGSRLPSPVAGPGERTASPRVSQRFSRCCPGGLRKWSRCLHAHPADTILQKEMVEEQGLPARLGQGLLPPPTGLSWWAEGTSWRGWSERTAQSRCVPWWCAFVPLFLAAGRTEEGRRTRRSGAVPRWAAPRGQPCSAGAILRAAVPVGVMPCSGGRVCRRAEPRAAGAVLRSVLCL